MKARLILAVLLTLFSVSAARAQCNSQAIAGAVCAGPVAGGIPSFQQTPTLGANGATAGSLTLKGSTSGSATISADSTGQLLLGNNVGSKNTIFNDGGNGTALIVGNAGGTIANQVTATPAIATAAPVLGATGTDTNINLTLTPKGSGFVLANGGLLSNSATQGLGYQTGTGVGGTVTQATNRTTAVTLNKPSGKITMFSAAGSGTPASFTVNNSVVGANDTVSLNIASGNSNSYFYFINSVTAGAFSIAFWTTGGTTVDAPVFNFNVIKGTQN